MPNNPFWFERNNHNIRSPKVADIVGNSFQPGYILQQASLRTSQYSPSPIYPRWQVMDDQINQSRLSQEKILKIEELKRLMYKYPQYHINPDDIIRLAIFNSINGDGTLLARSRLPLSFESSGIDHF
ncbi:MAG TPA: hypothetical protein VEH06_00110 [Candidatus Bathyarchaeia archaeon]|nr:hypothetical protein [Candidatus Bathyarchaeia archaeon]